MYYSNPMGTVMTFIPKKSAINILICFTSLTIITIATAQSFNQEPKHFTIFDAVGEMASGMAYVHVAIPLNLTTFTAQADILQNYLYKLSRVVSNNTEKETFLETIRDIARFGQTRLNRLRNRVKHIDRILPYDGDLTAQQRHSRSNFDQLDDYEIIDHKTFLNTNITNPLHIEDILINPTVLRNTNDITLQLKLKKLKDEYEIYLKNTKRNTDHRFKRSTASFALYIAKGLQAAINTLNQLINNENNARYRNTTNTYRHKRDTGSFTSYITHGLNTTLNSINHLINNTSIQNKNTTFNANTTVSSLLTASEQIIFCQNLLGHFRSILFTSEEFEQHRTRRDTLSDASEIIMRCQLAIVYFRSILRNTSPHLNSRTKRAALDSVYVSQIQLFEDLKLLQHQHMRIREQHTIIMYDTREIENEMFKLTNHVYVPQMDNIIEHSKYDALHKDLNIFQNIMSASQVKQHKQTTTPKPQQTTEAYDRSVYNNSDHYQRNKPGQKHDWTKEDIEVIKPKQNMTGRARKWKRDTSIDSRDMLLNDPTTIDLALSYRNLQIEVTELTVQAITALRVNINMQKKLDHLKLLKSKGKKTEFFNFDDIYKEIPNSTTGEINIEPKVGGRYKRVAPLIILAGIAGVLGTFMGMYNTYEISVLKTRLNEVEKNHNLLVHVTQKQEEQINRITENMNSIIQLIQMMIKFNPTLISEQIASQINLFETRVTIATNAVQQLQHRRLAVDLLDTNQLDEMHIAISKVATERGYKLMTERISDYFQIETSYLRNKGDILIMLHVPCIIHEQLLTIYRYISLPFPVPKILSTDSTTILDLILQRTGPTIKIQEEESQDALLLVPEAEMIAIGRDNQYQILSQSNLASCIKRNKVYLCDKSQVLQTDLHNSCLGSIYSNHEQGIKENCKLERKRLIETVYQLSSTDHLVYSPQPFSTKIQCKNGSSFPTYITKVHKIHVPEDCKLTLKAHTITSHFNIHISPEPLHIPWTLDPMTLPADILLGAALIDRKLNTLEYDLKALLNETSQKTNFSNMLVLESPFSYPWFIWVAGVTAMLGFSLLIFWYVYNVYETRKHALDATKQPQQIQGQTHIHIAPQENKNNLYPVPPYNL